MKRLVLMLATAAVLAVATPMSAPPAFARDDDRGRGAQQRQDRGADRGGPDRGGARRGDGDGRRYTPPPRGPQGDRGGAPRRYEEPRGAPPRASGDDGRRGRAPVLGYGDGPARRYEERPRAEDRPRYDPPQPRYGERTAPARPRGFAPAPSGARRGGYLPRNFNGEIVDDYRRYRLRTPPAGFAWVRMGNGFALVSMADGQVFDVVQ